VYASTGPHKTSKSKWPPKNTGPEHAAVYSPPKN